MFKLFFNYILFILFVTIVISCTHHGDDTEQPVIVIKEPLQGDTLRLSLDPEVHMEFTASDNDELHEVKVNVVNDANVSLYSNSKDVDEKVYSFHEHFVPIGITTVVRLTLKIDASDHNSNEVSKTVIFYIKP